MVGRSGAGASRRMVPKRTRGVSRSSGAVPARGDDVAVDSPVRGEEPLVHRCKQMSAVVAASVAVACVSVGYSLWQAAASQSAVDQATRDSAAVWVVSQDVKAGEMLDTDSLEVREVPAAFRSAAALPAQSTEPASSVSGMRALVDIPAGSQLCGTFLAGSGSDGRLAAQLSADKEAVSLSVDDETGIAGQVKPYDAVRVVSIEGASSGIVDSQTLANRARVVAVGGDGYDDGASYSAIVIEVSPDEADAIRQAQVSGKVSVQLLASEDVLTGGVDG